MYADRGQSSQIQVLIVEPHLVLRRGLQAILSADPALAVIAEVATEHEACDVCWMAQPQVALISVASATCPGIATIRAIHSIAPATQMIALGQNYDGERIYWALASGAISYVHADSPGAELLLAVHATAAGRPALDLAATRALLHTVSQPPEVALTPREREVLALLVRGLSNPAIAKQLMISRSTVKFHLSSIMAKLGTTSRTETVARAIFQNLVRMI